MKISFNNTKNIQKINQDNVLANKSDLINSKETVNAKSLNFSGAINSINVQNLTATEDKVFADFLSKAGKVTVDEYMDISQNHPRTLSKSYEMCSQQKLYTNPTNTAKFAISLKNHFDDLYGKDGYIIVSIGTSPAPISETIQNIGVKTVFLPATGLGRLSSLIKDNPIDGTIAGNFPNVKALMDYADMQGVKDNSKHVILLDYENCGHSLKTMEKIFLERGDIEEDKIHRCSVIETLSDILKNQNSANPWALDFMSVDDLKFDMSLSKVEKIGNIPHFEVNHQLESKYITESDIVGFVGPSQELFDKFDDFSLPQARAWALCSTHEAMKLLN